MYSLKKSKDIISLVEKEEGSVKAEYLYNYLDMCYLEYKEQLEIKKKNETFIINLELKKEHKQQKNLPQKIVDVTNIEQEKEVDVSNYLKEVMYADNFEELEIVLPKSDYRFNKLINLLILNLQKDINEIETFLINNTDSELENNLCMLKEKVELLLDYRDYEIEHISEENLCKPTFLIFVPNDNNNYNFIRDLKEITPEYLETIKKGLEDLKNNKAITYRYFSSSNKNVSGISEIRTNNQCRIIIDRHSNDLANFVFIISILQKKYWSSSYYFSYLKNRISQYKKYYNKALIEIEGNLEYLTATNEENYNTAINFINEEIGYEKSRKIN